MEHVNPVGVLSLLDLGDAWGVLQRGVSRGKLGHSKGRSALTLIINSSDDAPLVQVVLAASFSLHYRSPYQEYPLLLLLYLLIWRCSVWVVVVHVVLLRIYRIFVRC